jgi:hypothetical protein
MSQYGRDECQRTTAIGFVKFAISRPRDAGDADHLEDFDLPWRDPVLLDEDSHICSRYQGRGLAHLGGELAGSH